MENVFYWGNLILSYGITGYVMFRFLFALFKPKYNKGIYYLAFCVFVLLSIWINQLNIPLLKSFYGIIATCIICSLLFYDSIKRKVIAVGLFFFLYIMMTDVISVLIFTLFTKHTIEATMGNNLYLFICGLINQVILLCFYRPILGIIQKHKFDSITKQQNLFLIILAVFEITLLNYISIVVDNTISSVILTFLSSGFLALDIYLIYLFEAISQKYQLEKEMELRDQQLSMQNNYYKSIETQYDYSRRIIHDMKNHMQTLEEIYANGDIFEAQKYAHTIYEAMDKMGSRFKCNSRILSIIINDKLLKCDEKRIKISINVEDIDLSFMETFDITTIFSNVLDNAIEACEKVEENKREINIKVFHFNEFLTIGVENSFNEILQKSKDTFKTTKGKHHMGLGLKNVKEAVDKYEGIIKFSQEDNTFKVKILVPTI